MVAVRRGRLHDPIRAQASAISGRQASPWRGKISKRLSLGAEVYHQSADADDARDFTGVNLGAIYKLTNHWSLLASGGPGIQNAREQGRYYFYLSLKADY